MLTPSVVQEPADAAVLPAEPHPVPGRPGRPAGGQPEPGGPGRQPGGPIRQPADPARHALNPATAGVAGSGLEGRLGPGGLRAARREDRQHKVNR